MAKILFVPLLFVLAAPAAAGVPQRVKADQNTPRHGNYWLSNDLNRLVFWQPPTSASPRR